MIKYLGILSKSQHNYLIKNGWAISKSSLEAVEYAPADAVIDNDLLKDADRLLFEKNGKVTYAVANGYDGIRDIDFKYIESEIIKKPFKDKSIDLSL